MIFFLLFNSLNGMRNLIHWPPPIIVQIINWSQVIAGIICFQDCPSYTRKITNTLFYHKSIIYNFYFLKKDIKPKFKRYIFLLVYFFFFFGYISISYLTKYLPIIQANLLKDRSNDIFSYFKRQICNINIYSVI